MGLIPFIRSTMYNAESPSSYDQLRMQIYGPPGVRSYVRFNLNMTQASLIGRYAVHELLHRGEEPSVGCEATLLHSNEAPGMDIVAGEDGLWRDFASYMEWSVDAGSLTHRSTSLSPNYRTFLSIILEFVLIIVFLYLRPMQHVPLAMSSAKHLQQTTTLMSIYQPLTATHQPCERRASASPDRS
jgi:hypothetical protein